MRARQHNEDVRTTDTHPASWMCVHERRTAHVARGTAVPSATLANQPRAPGVAIEREVLTRFMMLGRAFHVKHGAAYRDQKEMLWMGRCPSADLR
jgi:hypothetical protein